MGLKKYRVKNKLAENIEAEEIFLDAEAIRSIDDKGKMEQPIKQRTFIAFFLVIVLGILGLLVRAAQLQIIEGDYYWDLAQGNKLRVFSLTAPRGIIYDKNFEQLVYNVPSFDLIVILADFYANEKESQQEILDRLSEILRVEVETLALQIEQAKGEVSSVILKENIEHDKALKIESLIRDWSGLRLDKNARRNYVMPYDFSHLIGYTGRVGAEDLADNPDYLLNDFIGRAGLELSYEEVLRGQPGREQVEVNSIGQIQKILATKASVPGQGLLLNIDSSLQKKLYQSLSAKVKELGLQKAAAVVVDPRNGGIRALVSLPSYDSDIFCQSVSASQYEQLCRNPSQPLFNRATAGQYPSGSTIKPLIAAAALQEGVISASRKINCTGAISVTHQYNPEIVYYFKDWKTHSITDIIKAIAQSCNVFFYTIGGGFGDIEGLGIAKIKEYLELFGLGQLTGIDLASEEKGLIPDKAWKRQAKEGEPWYIGDTYHVAIGQGDLLVTPLQMAMATAVVANNGTLYKPQIVDRVIDSDKNTIQEIEPEILKQNFIDQDNLSIVRAGMRQAVFDGSAWALAELEVETAGKTGTAQYGAKDKTHAWFTGFAPYQESEIAIAVIIEDGGEGSKAAAPVAKEVFEYYFNPSADNNNQ